MPIDLVSQRSQVDRIDAGDVAMVIEKLPRSIDIALPSGVRKICSRMVVGRRGAGLAHLPVASLIVAWERHDSVK